MGSFKKSISVAYCQGYFRFLSQTFDFSESGSLSLHKCVKRYGASFRENVHLQGN